MHVNFENIALVSALTALTTECIKKVFAELKIRYVSNVIAVTVSIILSVAVGIIKPVMYYAVELDAGVIYDGMILAFFSVLCATLSFDKVKQAIDRLKGD